MALVRLLLDQNILDYLVDEPDVRSRVVRAVDQGRAGVLYTHLQRDAVNQTAAAGRRAALEGVLAELRAKPILTHGAVWDVSKSDESSWTSAQDAGRLGVFRAERGLDDVRDALVAATTDRHRVVLVTGNKRLAGDAIERYPGPERYPNLEVWDVDDLHAWLGSDAAR